jgi:hypothetical protein
MGPFRQVQVLLFICFESCSAQQVEPGRASVTDPTSELQVVVNVYNGVNLPSSDLARAEQEAEKIFLYAGIRLIWKNGLLSAGVKRGAPIVSSSPASLHLRIWTRAMVGKTPALPETLGFCLSLENRDAVVLADAIQKRAVFGSTNFDDLLGLAMAHELGHLLLQSARHSVTGIMRARWTEKGLAEDYRGYLRFTSREAQSMRNEVRRRMRLKKLGEILTAPHWE